MSLFRTTYLSAIVGLFGFAAACGNDEDAARSGSSDAGTEAAIAFDASDEGAFDATTEGSTSSIPRCPGATYERAPSGAACDPERIERQRGLEGSCYGPAVGDGCRRLEVSVAPSEDAAALPLGFACTLFDGGAQTCQWTFDDDASTIHLIDEAALEGACGATTALPDATVLCTNSGS